MSDFGRQFDLFKDYPVVRSVMGGEVRFTSIDPEGNRAHDEWADRDAHVAGAVDDADEVYNAARSRYDAAQSDHDAERSEASAAVLRDADSELESAIDAVDTAYDNLRRHEDSRPDPHAIGTVKYIQQQFRPTTDLDTAISVSKGEHPRLFTESQIPVIDMWAADPAYAGEGVGKELLNHAVEEHWTHFPKERGTMPPISHSLSGDSLEMLERYAGEDAGNNVHLWTDNRDRMDRFARETISESGGRPASRYMDAAGPNGRMLEEGTELLDRSTARRSVRVTNWPPTSFEDKVGELEARGRAERLAEAEQRGRWTGPLAKAEQTPGTAAHLAAQFDSPTGQLPLFVTGRELRGAATPHPGDRLNETDGLDRTESIQELWARKKSEADASGMTESIAKRGIVRPVRITGGGTIKNGNHRGAALGDDQWTSPDYDDNEGSMPGPMGDTPARFRPELVGLPKFNAR